MNLMTKSVIASLVFHAALLISFGGAGGKGDAEQAKESKDNVPKQQENIADKPKESQEIDLVEITEEQRAALEAAKKKPKPKKPQCEHYFGGIGVEMGISVQGAVMIGKVWPNYPAANAGLQAYDVILSPSPAGIRGEPGSRLDMIIERGGQRFAVTVLRDRICLEQGANK